MTGTKTSRQRLALEPYWYLIGFLLLVAAVLYLIHLFTGFTPSRVAVRIPGLDLDVYWYGICIVGGVALGAYVVSHLVLARAQAVWEATVPLTVRRVPLTHLRLPEEIGRILTKRDFQTAGDLLLWGGFHPRNWGLNAAGIEKVQASLAELPGYDPAWLEDSPWRIWDPEHVWNGLIWCLVLGVIGARLYHVLTPSPSMAAVGIHSPLDYFRHPEQILNLRTGGLGIYGGIAGGALGLLWYTRRQRLPTIAWADLAVIGLALGQVFGRWGNFFNQELYGAPTNLPWAVTIDPVYRLPEYSSVAHFHPAFLYESLWNLLTFFVLYFLLRRYAGRLLTGDLMGLYLIFYGIGRTLLETVRLDSRTVTLGGVDLNVAVATLVSLVVALIMALWVGQRHWRKRPPAGSQQPRPQE